MNTSEKRKKNVIPLDVDSRQLFRIIVILIFAEKVITANANADPTKTIKKQRYLFDASIQHIWDCLPKEDVPSDNISSALRMIYNFASRRDAVCVRTLLNTSLELINHLKTFVIDPFPLAHLLNVESSVYKILQEYDPNISHDESYKTGVELADEILAYLELL